MPALHGGSTFRHELLGVPARVTVRAGLHLIANAGTVHAGRGDGENLHGVGKFAPIVWTHVLL
jgi:hypothetical protein